MVDYYNTSVINKGKARVHGKWVNYFYNGWKPLNLNFVNDGSNFTSNGGPFTFQSPQFSNGIAFLSITNKYDIFSKSTISDSDMVFEIVAENTSGVAGVLENDRQVWYHNAFGNGISLRNTIWHGRAPRLTKEVVIDPTVVSNQDVTVSWLVTSPNALSMINGERPKNPNGESWTGATGDTTNVTGPVSVHYYAGGLSPVRGSGFRKPVAWYYSNGKTIFADVTVSITIVDTSTIRITKTINKDIIAAAGAAGSLLFADDVQTIYPDPHAESTSCDGYTQRNIHYTTYHLYGGATTCQQLCAGAATTLDDDYFLNSLNHYFGGGAEYHFSRIIMGFDLSALSGSVTAATLNVSTWKGSVTSRVTGASPASNTGLALADHQDIWDNYDASLSDNTFVGSGSTAITLTQPGLDYLTAGLGSVTFLALRHANDKVGAADIPNGSELHIYGAEQSGTAADPYLEVTYGAAAGIIYNQRQILIKNQKLILK